MNKKIFTLLTGTFLMFAAVFMVTAQTGTPLSYIDQQVLGLGKPVDTLILGANPGYYHLNVVAVGTGATVAGGVTTISYDRYVGGSGAVGFEDYVLFMGVPDAGTYPVFVDRINHNDMQPKNVDLLKTGTTTGDPALGTHAVDIIPSNSDVSASSLWCTYVTEYNQGKNVIFDFINKQQKEVPLEVEIDGYEEWDLDPDNDAALKVRTSGDVTDFHTWLVPGTISGWEFSHVYEDKIDPMRPLVSYLTAARDTVAVLCIEYDYGNWDEVPQGNVVIKIASADDVANRKVVGVMYFTLTQALPFTLSPYDFNTMLGTEDDDFGQLVFSKNANPNKDATENLFTRKLYAEDIARDRLVILNVEDVGAATGGTFKLYEEFFHDASSATPFAPLGPASISSGTVVPSSAFGADGYDILGGLGQSLTMFGYIHLANMSSGAGKQYLSVKQDYYIDRPSGTRSLNFGFRDLGAGAIAQWWEPGGTGTGWAIEYNDTYDEFDDLIANDPDAWENAFMFGQSVWRLVYYPSGDSIYINPYQATYLPLDLEDVPLVVGGETINYMRDPYVTGHPRLDWNDWYTQSSNVFTYRAYPYWEGDGSGADNDYLALDPLSVDLTQFEAVDETSDAFARMVARLKFGLNSVVRASDRGEYKFYHKLYVTVQDVNTATGVRLVTLRDGESIARDHTINTRIHFGCYEPCSDVSSNRKTIEPDLYLIRNERGEYLHVPLYSATDSAMWIPLTKDVHPEFLPSYQWVVQKKYPNSETSPIILINREFDELVFEDIILYKDQKGPFVFRVPNNFKWNQPESNAGIPYRVNSAETVFGQHTNNNATFVKLGKAYKDDEKMGYTYINPDESVVEVYSFKWLSGATETPQYLNTKTYDWYYKYPATDTTVYVHAGVNDYNKLYFRIDTINEPVGAYRAYGYDPDAYGNNIPDLVQLKRQAYQLWLEDPFLLLCDKTWGLTNGIVNDQYTISPNPYLFDFLGRPAFYLRHYYHLNGDKDDPGFALVQKIDPESFNPSSTQMGAFLDYIEFVYKGDYRGEVATQIAKMQDSSLDLGFFVAAVVPQTHTLKASLRIAGTTISTFQMDPDDDPIYRRFNKSYDHPDGLENDDPKVLKFYSMDRQNYELFENTGEFEYQRNHYENYGTGAYNTVGRKNYLGLINIYDEPTASTAIYVDTAYVNRGTGYIKPQYLLMVDPEEFEGGMACDDLGRPIIPIEPYLRGRYLINATDSAKNKDGEIMDKDYIWDTKWDRLVFTDAIHARDHLYILNGIDPSSSMYTSRLADGTYVLDLDLLDIEAAKANSKIRKVFLGDNLHKDVVFQMRLIERGATDFIIESETGNFNSATAEDNRYFHFTPSADFEYENSDGPMIAPCVGGWIKIQNQVPVIGRSDVIDSINDALRMNVRWTADDPVNNESVAAAAAPVVIGNDGSVTIFNAAGKKVQISNILGQTIANAVLSSDNATIAAPKGVVIVAIEGEEAVKALVK